MSDKIEYSRMLVKRTAQTGEVPTVPPITAVTLNQFIPTDLFVGEFFLNEVDDLLWIRTENGILPISLSGSTGTTSTQSLTQTLFYGNATNGYDIEVSAGDTIVFSGLSTGSTTQFLGIDASGNTIVSSVTPGTPDLEDVLSVGNSTGAYDISVDIGYKVEGQSGGNWVRPETADGNLELNVDNELTIVGIPSGTTGVFLSYDPDTKYVRYQAGGANGTSGTSGVDGTSGTSGVDGSNGSAGLPGSNGTSGTSGVSGDALWTSGSTVGSLTSVVGSNTNANLNSLVAGSGNTLVTSVGSVVLGENNSVTNSIYSLVGGSGNDVTGSTLGGNIVWGLDNILDQTTSFPFASATFGRENTVYRPYSVTAGYGNSHQSLYGVMFGIDNNSLNLNNYTFVAGSQNTIDGSLGGFVVGFNNYLTGNRNAVIGGQGITGSTDDMVYVPNLTIVSATTGTSIANLGIDSTGKIIKTMGSVDDYVPYNLSAPLSLSSNLTRYISPVNFTIGDIKANVFPAPGSENLQIDILKNGTSIFDSGNIITINSGNTTNQGSDPYTLATYSFNEWDAITFSATSFSGSAIVYINGCQLESCGIPVTPTPTPSSSSTPTPTPTYTPTPTPTATASGDADATAYLAAVVATGGTVDGTITTAVNNLFTSLKSAGIYSKLDILMPMVGATQASVVINAKAPTDNTTKWTPYGTALTYDISGVTGNGNGVLKSNFVMSGLTQATSGSSHFAIWVNKVANNSGGEMLNGYLRTSIGNARFTCANYYNASYNVLYGTQAVSNAWADTTGWWFNNRVSSSDLRFYSNNTQIGVNTNTITVNPIELGNNLALFTLYWPESGGANGLYNGEIGNQRYCTVTIGSGLNSTERTDLYNIITTFNTALSRA